MVAQGSIASPWILDFPRVAESECLVISCRGSYHCPERRRRRLLTLIFEKKKLLKSVK